MYDIHDRQSFEQRVKFWLEALTVQAKPIMLLGNKSHMRDYRKVSTEEAKEFAGDDVLKCLFLWNVLCVWEQMNNYVKHTLHCQHVWCIYKGI